MKLLDFGLPQEPCLLQLALRNFDHPLSRVNANHSSSLMSKHFQKRASATADFQDSRVWTNHLCCDFLSHRLKVAEGQDIHPSVEAPRGLLENPHQYKCHLM